MTEILAESNQSPASPLNEHLEPLFDQLEPAEIDLSQIFLDPNNPRFVGLQSQYVPDERAHENDIQAEAQRLLDERFGIDRIRMNMTVNGYLPIDRIIVRPLPNNNYLVLEGNRRIAAAKTVQQYTEDGVKTDERVIRSLKTIPVLLYTGEDSNAAWLFQGIRHIVGINDWSAYNKARLLVEQMQREGLSLTSAGRRFGLTRYGAGQWLRSYFAFKQAKEETDYVIELDERFYPYIQEIFGRSSVHVREWLGWDESSQTFADVARLNEFVGWFYPRTGEGIDPDDTSVRGDWERKRIGNRDDIRQLSWLVKSAPQYFDLFRNGLDFDDAYSRAKVDEHERRRKDADRDAKQELLEALQVCTRLMNQIPLALVKDEAAKAEISSKSDELKQAIDFALS